VGVVREELVQSAVAVGSVVRNRDLRRVELALAGSELGDWAWVIALAVFAYDSGGATAVGLVGLLRILPAAFAAPFASVLADRFPRRRVMVSADIGRAIVLGVAAAAVSAAAPAGLVYGLAALVSLIATAFRPAQAALLPNIARTPEELTAANIASSTIESVTMFGGPALGGLVLAATSMPVVFAMSAAAFVWSAVLVSGISDARDRPQAAERKETVVSAALAGFRTVLADRRVLLLVSLLGAQTLVAGALNVLVVVTALELLDLGEAGVGYLFSAVGIGGLVGAAASLALVGRRRLAFAFGLGVLAWGLPIALIAASSSTAMTLILLGIVGLANTVVDVAGLTLLQRAVPDDVLARVFGVLETFMLATVALGSALAAVLVSTLGTRAALAVVGCFLPALVLLFWRRLAHVDAAAPVPGRGLELLRRVPFLAGLPAATLEHLAGSLTALTLPAGSRVFAAGERGDRFYVIDVGEVDISADDRRLAVGGPGAYFGEIALLRAVPRTATVTARSDVSLYLLDRDEFVAAVTGHASSREAADAVVASRLSSLRPDIASL
jgi:MFS family permease